VEDDLILTVGTRGRGKGEFANPQGVAVSSTGRILVSDSNNQCVQVRKK
jgi:tripartite motif-containing protein 2/3